MSENEPYSEGNPDHTPDPTEVLGTYDTSGTAGPAHEDVSATTRVFEVADAQQAEYNASAQDVVDSDTDSDAEPEVEPEVVADPEPEVVEEPKDEVVEEKPKTPKKSTKSTTK